MPNRSTEARVITETSSPPPICMRTSAMTPPSEIAVTRPRSWFLALISTSASSRPRVPRRNPATICSRGNSHLRPTRAPGSFPVLASAWTRLT